MRHTRTPHTTHQLEASGVSFLRTPIHTSITPDPVFPVCCLLTTSHCTPSNLLADTCYAQCTVRCYETMPSLFYASRHLPDVCSHSIVVATSQPRACESGPQLMHCTAQHSTAQHREKSPLSQSIPYHHTYSTTPFHMVQHTQYIPSIHPSIHPFIHSFTSYTLQRIHSTYISVRQHWPQAWVPNPISHPGVQTGMHAHRTIVTAEDGVGVLAGWRELFGPLGFPHVPVSRDRPPSLRTETWGITVSVIP